MPATVFCLPWEFFGWAGAAYSYVPKQAFTLWSGTEVLSYRRTGEARYPSLAVPRNLRHNLGFTR